ncbi:MAG: hypothetical protein HYT67_02400 [Candidatus Yanofskybacteria bacterium]|nr:hypothetical protein [Candidatus Yanofskybacteria bacterium]
MTKESLNSATNPDLTPEQEVAKTRMIELLSAGKTDLALQIKEGAKLSEQVIQSSEVQNVIKDIIRYFLSSGYTWLATEIIEGFSVSPEAIRDSVKSAVIEAASHGSVEEIMKIKEEFEVPEEVFKSQEAQEAAKKGANKLIERRYGSDAQKLKEVFGIT